jgi:two-component system OmpR family response regulator
VSQAAQTSTLLIVEKDDDARQQMAAYLSSHGHPVREAADEAAAGEVLAEGVVALILLEADLTGGGGLAMLRSLVRPGGPLILVLSDQADPIDRILALELGADDYIIKPIPERELLAKIKAMLRRRLGEAPPSPPAAVEARGYSDLRLDAARRRIAGPKGSPATLTRGEMSILVALMESRWPVVPRQELERRLRGVTAEGVSRSVDQHVSRLRRKILIAAGEDLIKTCRGVGYALSARLALE